MDLEGKMFPMKPKPQPKKERGNKCRISIKKKADGTIIKEVSGECSSVQLKALSEIKDKEEE